MDVKGFNFYGTIHGYKVSKYYHQKFIFTKKNIFIMQHILIPFSQECCIISKDSTSDSTRVKTVVEI